MYLTYSHYYTYIKIPASAEKICGRRGFCRKLFFVEFECLRYNEPIEFFYSGKDRRLLTRKFKDLTIRDAFMFAAVMSDPEICRRVIELAQIDMDALLSGDSYENLPDTYVIFICDFDPFGEGLYRYSTRTFCEETSKPVNDGIETFYLNAHGRNRDSIPDELLQFLDYVKDTGRTETISTTDPFVRHLQNTIDAIKQNRSMEERYMLLEEMMRNEKQEGIQQGSQQMIVQCLVDFLEAKFSVSDAMLKKIKSETDICKLRAWFQLSLKVSSIEEFEKNM